MLRTRTSLFLLLFITCLPGFTGGTDIKGAAYSAGVFEKAAVPQTEETVTESSFPQPPEDLLFRILSLRKKMTAVTEMEALDRVKERYASNFIKVSCDGESEAYYYKLEGADYYLVSEGLEDDRYYLIHLYEFVVDEEESGIGHTYTYGWYAVDQKTGEIIIRMAH